jgi:hypothetical protein
MEIVATIFAFIIVLNCIIMVATRLTCEHEWKQNGSKFILYCEKCGKERHFYL